MTLLNTLQNRIAGACLLVGVGCLGVACDKAADDQRKAYLAQNEAADKIAQATREADEKIASADASFKKLREDYRHSTTTNLVDLDRDVAALATKATLLTGKAKTELDANLVLIQARRTAFVKEYEALDSFSGATWDNTKTRLDTQWRELKALVDKA